MYASNTKSSPSLSEKYGAISEPYNPTMMGPESSSTEMSDKAFVISGASLPPITITLSARASLDMIPSLILAKINNCPEKFRAGVIVYPFVIALAE